MSAISNFLNTIRTAIYGEQVRGAIADAITQCYDDVSSPSLNTAAFASVVADAYADGFLDIQEKSTIAGMTNEKIIYRYTGSEAGYIHNGLYYFNGSSWKPIGSGIQIATTAAGMTDVNAIYKYTGNETGYVTNGLYYFNGTAFVTIADKIITDKTMTEDGGVADAKVVGERFDAQGLKTAQYVSLKKLLLAATYDTSVIGINEITAAIETLIGTKDLGVFTVFSVKNPTKKVSVYSDTGTTLLNDNTANGTRFLAPTANELETYTVKTKTTVARTATVYVGYTVDNGATIYNAVALNSSNSLPKNVEFSETVNVPVGARLAAFVTMTGYGYPSDSGYQGSYESIWYYKGVQ